MTSQLELFFPSPKPGEPAPAEVASFVEFLRGKGWQKAAQIAASTGWSDRHCRSLAAASKGHVISGQLGYKLTNECTPLEFGRFEGFFRSQIREMTGRLRDAERVYHRAGHGTR